MAAQKILIVEDNAANMELVSDLLDVAGYIVLQATSAEVGIKVAKAELPDLILMDEGLPGMDGLTAVQVLRQDAATEHIPIVMVTAHAMKGDRERAMQAGCAGHITKPIDTRNFPKLVAQHLGETGSSTPVKPETQTATEAKPAVHDQAHARRILIVDDEAPNRDLLEGLVETFGHQPITASSGAEALELISPDIDLVLLDVMMPGMDGFEVARRIRDHTDGNTLPIVMTTALTEKSDRLRAVEAGANDFITKPIDKTELKVRMMSQLRLKEAQDEVKCQREELRRRNAEMEADLNLAREIQQAFLPQQYISFPRLASSPQGALQFHHRYQPASTLGGDFTDVLILSDTRVGVFICDVMGHGVRSALVTAVTRGLIEELLPGEIEPGQFLSQLNKGLMAILKRTRTPMFASAFFLVADLETKTMAFANAGHPSPLHLRRDSKTVAPLLHAEEGAGPALGVLEEYSYTSFECPLHSGDLFLLFTDGLTEVACGEDEYGEKRLLQAVEQRHALSATPLLDELIEEIKNFGDEKVFEDDVCLIGMEVMSV